MSQSNDNDEPAHSYQCSICQQVGVPFSKRQANRAQMGEPDAKCRNCAGGGDQKEDVEEDDVVVMLEKETDNDNDAPEQQASKDATEEETPSSKKERKRLKKEKKRLKKEKKKASRKEGETKSPVPSSSSESQSSEETAEEAEAKVEAEVEVEAKFSNNENEEITEAEATFSDAEEEENKAQFSEDENENKAQFSDAEMVDADEHENQDQSNNNNNNELQVPRKGKSPNAASRSSLTANMKAAKPQSNTITLMDDDDDDDEEDFHDQEGYDDPGSLAALKQNIMGRKIRTHEDADEEDRKPAAQPYTTDAKISHQLRRELSCAICHECYLHPVSLLCGHSFCRECIQWWWQSSTSTAQASTKSCPTCRSEMPQATTFSFGVNTALRACVLALLGNEIQARLEAQRQATKGENEGAHDAGYERLVSEKADTWKTPGIPWSCRRSTVLDAEDQRMQLAMAIWKDTTYPGVCYNPREQTLTVSLCMLQMEEDEVADGGFPRVLHEDDEEDNEQLLVSRQGGRFVHSFVRATAYNGKKKIPLGRRSIQDDGIAELKLELTSPEVTEAEYIAFEHEESGAVMDLRVPSNLGGPDGGGEAKPPRRQTSGRTASTAVELPEDDEEEAYLRNNKAHDSEDDGSHLDQFEDDGFIDDGEGEGEEEHEDDVCAICKQGGEVMICDGGDNMEGCARSFHIGCVNRQEVPRGDWICKECAEQLGLDVGAKGHEFPMLGACEVCEGDGVELVCDGGEHIQSCGKKFHLGCVNRDGFPKGDWICEDCALQVGEEAGPEGHEYPTGSEEADAIELDETASEASPPPKKKQKVAIQPEDVIDVDDSEEEPDFASPAKGGRHIGGDSDEEGGGEDDDELEVLPPRAKKPEQKRITLDDEDADE